MGQYLKKFFNSIAGIGHWAFLTADTFAAAFRRAPHSNLVLDQLYQIGVLSLPVVAVTGFSTGLVLAAQAHYQLADKGLVGMTGLFVGKSMLTEIGPVLTAFMVTGRVGSAMCAMLGSMKVTEQIDAIRSMAVNPLRYLVAPRVIASLVMLPLLTIFSALLGIYGGYLLSVFVFDMAPQAYFDPMPIHITMFDFWTGLIKGLVFAFLISTISCYKGLTVQGGAAGVGRATTNSVVICYSAILIINFILTIALNVIHNYFIESRI